MKWHIGQPIVAIKNHSQGAFKKGDEFIINGLRDPMCKCNDTLIDIGMVGDNISGCTICNKLMLNHGIYWFSETMFAPLDVDISELTEILEQPQHA